jgi:hypothetical protein
MNSTLRKYLHSLEFAAVGAAVPVLNQWLMSSAPMDSKTVVKALIGAAITGAYTFVRANPPPVDPDITPVTPLKKP